MAKIQTTVIKFINDEHGSWRVEQSLMVAWLGVLVFSLLAVFGNHSQMRIAVISIASIASIGLLGVLHSIQQRHVALNQPK
jgi:Flp pilus assembly pilin Flp